MRDAVREAQQRAESFNQEARLAEERQRADKSEGRLRQISRGIHDHDCVERKCEYVDGEDFAVLLEVAEGVTKRRRKRGQSRVYETPVQLIEAIVRKYKKKRGST